MHGSLSFDEQQQIFIPALILKLGTYRSTHVQQDYLYSYIVLYIIWKVETNVSIHFKMQWNFYISYRKFILQIQSLHRRNQIMQPILHLQHNFCLWTKPQATRSGFEVRYNIWTRSCSDWRIGLDDLKQSFLNHSMTL